MKKNYFTMFTHDRKILVYSFISFTIKCFPKMGGKGTQKSLKQERK